MYEHVKADVHLASISGGTDLCGCFVGGDPTRPVYAGEIQGPALGMAVDVWSRRRLDRCRPARARASWCAPRRSRRCRSASGATTVGRSAPLPGRVLRAVPRRLGHGDFASWTDHGGVVIHGRSDATLNAGGVRIGTAEIYRLVERQPEVAEALAVRPAVGRRHPHRAVRAARRGTWRSTTSSSPGRAALRPSCRPATSRRSSRGRDLPRTRSGKLVELAVADVVNGRPVRNTEAIANPEAIDAIAALPELQP